MLMDVNGVTALQTETVARWHHEEISNPYDGFLAICCSQHIFNFRLWHEEDIARSPDVSDAQIAQVKRNIDKLNQQRNDWIEKLDDWLTEQLQLRNIQPLDGARQNTETPGSAIDRLSILSLRIYHLEEQCSRSDAGAAHLESVSRKLGVCRMQRDDLSRALRELLDDIESGRKRHKTYRQFKMYNDPTLNPYLYQRKVADKQNS